MPNYIDMYNQSNLVVVPSRTNVPSLSIRRRLIVKNMWSKDCRFDLILDLTLLFEKN